MALTVRTDGTAVVEEPKATTTAAGAVANGGETAKDTTTTTTTTKTDKTDVPANATVGLDFKTVKQNLSASYDSKYDEQLADLYNQITQRKPFTYSTDDDMLYKMYEQKYTQQGQKAMRDTIGQTAALTGGYGNSYAQRVGQETYDEYLQQLYDLIPGLQDAAYQRYTAEGDKLNQQYGLLSDLEDKDLNLFKLNYGQNVDAYERFMNEAAALGAAGDFSGYEEIFGKKAAQTMKRQYEFEKILPLYQAGLIDDVAFSQILNPYLTGMGIDLSILADSDDGGGGRWEYGGSGWNGGNFYAENGIYDPYWNDI